MLLALACALACLLALTSLEPLPGWDSDPAIMLPGLAPDAGRSVLATLAASTTGSGPSLVVTLCVAITLLCAATIGLAPPRSDRPNHARTLVPLAAIASAGLVYHSRWPVPNPDAVRLCAAWLAGLWLLLACWRSEVAKPWLAGLVIGTACLFAAKGLVQVFVQHPRTLVDFEQTRETFFAARGWKVGDPLSLIYERRLKQREISGWFGLSNVLASFGAATAVACAAVTLQTTFGRGRRVGWPARVALALGAVLGCVVLVGAGSKGGFAAAGIGAAAAALAWFWSRRASHIAQARSPQPEPRPARPALAWPVAGAIVLAPHAALAVRGVIGERWSELSLWFRWFYAEAAARIGAGALPLGVGPTGFRRAYVAYCNPLSPEQIESPHSVLWDWFATLGIGGIAMGAILLGATAACVRAIARSRTGLEHDASEHTNPQGSTPMGRPLVYATLVTVLGIAVVAAAIERSVSLPVALADWLAADVGLGGDVALLAAAALVALVLVAWCGIVLASCVVGDRRPCALAVALACAAIALIVHAQMEMTPVVTTAGPLFAAIVGLAAAGAARTPNSSVAASSAAAPARATARAHRGLAVVALVAALAGPGLMLPSVVRWESALVRSASVLAPIAQARALAGANQESQASAQDWAAVTRHAQRFGAADASGRIHPALWRARAGAEAERLLAQASMSRTHAPTVRARIGNLVVSAEAARAAGLTELADAALLRAIGEPTGAPQRAALGWPSNDAIDDMPDPARTTDPAMVFGSRASARQIAGQAWGQPAQHVLAEQDLLRAIDRRSMEPRLALLELRASHLPGSDVVGLAREVLELDMQFRLDPLRQLGPAARARVERWASGESGR